MQLKLQFELQKSGKSECLFESRGSSRYCNFEIG